MLFFAKATSSSNSASRSFATAILLARIIQPVPPERFAGAMWQYRKIRIWVCTLVHIGSNFFCHCCSSQS